MPTKTQVSIFLRTKTLDELKVIFDADKELRNCFSKFSLSKYKPYLEYDLSYKYAQLNIYLFPKEAFSYFSLLNTLVIKDLKKEFGKTCKKIEELSPIDTNKDASKSLNCIFALNAFKVLYNIVRNIKNPDAINQAIYYLENYNKYIDKEDVVLPKFLNEVVDHACIYLSNVKLTLQQKKIFNDFLQKDRFKDTDKKYFELVAQENLVESGIFLLSNKIPDQKEIDISLYIAAISGNLQILELMQEFDCITEKALEDKPFRGSSTPLVEAAIRGHVGVVKFLLKQKANMNVLSKKGENILELITSDSSNLNEEELFSIIDALIHHDKHKTTLLGKDLQNKETSKQPIAKKALARIFSHNFVDFKNEDLEKVKEKYDQLYKATQFGSLDPIKKIYDKYPNDFIRLFTMMNPNTGKRPIEVCYENGHSYIFNYLITKEHFQDLYSQSFKIGRDDIQEFLLTTQRPTLQSIESKQTWQERVQSSSISVSR